MKGSRLSLVLGIALSIVTPAIGQDAAVLCPVEIDTMCLETIADHVIAAQPEEAQRQSLALNYAAVLVSKTPDHASRLIREFSQGANCYSLMRAADSLAAGGQTEEAAGLIWAAAEARAQDPELRAKVLDMLLLVEDAAKINDLALARRILGTIVPYLPGDYYELVPFSDALRLTRLMSLYGWPEDAHPILDAVYALLPNMVQDSRVYGVTLTRLMTVAVLSGQHDLHQKLEVDISHFLMRAVPRVQNEVKRSYVTALAKAGLIEQATARAAEYGLDFDETIRHVPHPFFGEESDYYPGIADDTLRRFEAILAAVKSPAIKAEFLAELAGKMIENKQYDGLDGLLERVTDPALRGDLVRELMIYHARERDDAHTAANLYFAEKPEFVANPFNSGTLLARYPLSLTAQGLLEAGDLERGGELADEVLKLWLADQSNRRRLETLLVGALATVGDRKRVNEWYTASDDPGHKMDVLIAVARAQANAGEFGEINSIRAQLTELFSQLPDVERSAPAFWPEGLPYLTPREELTARLAGLDESIAIALAKADQPIKARKILEAREGANTYPWRAELEIANAVARGGDKDQAADIKRAILDQLLQGGIDARSLPYVINAML